MLRQPITKLLPSEIALDTVDRRLEERQWEKGGGQDDEEAAQSQFSILYNL